MRTSIKPSQKETRVALDHDVETKLHLLEESDQVIEELEAVIAPGTSAQHNETLASDSEEIELDIEELEALIAPGVKFQHNETLVRDDSN